MNTITEEELNEIFQKYEPSPDEIAKQLKNILDELCKDVSGGERERLIKIIAFLGQNRNIYIDAIKDLGIVQGADDKLKEIENKLRQANVKTKYIILDYIKTQTLIQKDDVKKEPNVGSWTLNGDYITHYEDRSGGQIITISAPATIHQKGFDIQGKTTQKPGKTWILEGKIGAGGYVYGKYYAESPFDTGRGNFFLRINATGDLDGIWSGYDHENKIITSGRYWFRCVPKIQIQSITQSYYTKVLDLSSRLLGKGYLPDIPESDKNKSVFLVAISSKELIGFANARITEKDELKVILKNRKIDRIPPDIKRADEAGTLGFLKTVCVEPDFQGRGVATTLIKKCLNNLVTLGAETLICIAWKSSAGAPICGILSKLGFREWITLDKFWAEESKSLNYSCPVCGDPPCNCSAVIYKCTDFSKIVTENS